jgi:transcriptional regulator
MHPNPAFRQTPRDRNLAFARSRGFGVLMLNGPEGPLAAHVPFLLSDDGSTAHLHLVRSNPIARALAEPQPALIVVHGADSYISPDWYGVPDQVPTWNYVAVHLRGRLAIVDDAEMHAVLDRQSAEFEARLQPKRPWTTGKMPPDLMERMMRQIVPARMEIATVDGTWKLNQNKPDDARKAAADAVERHGIGSDTALLASLMRDPPPPLSD